MQVSNKHKDMWKWEIGEELRACMWCVCGMQRLKVGGRKGKGKRP